MRSGVQPIPPMNAVYFGVNAAEALAMEVKKRQSQRVFLLVSGTQTAKRMKSGRFAGCSESATLRNLIRCRSTCLVMRS